MNLHDSGRFCTESLESASKRYKTLGFSIIPLLGGRNSQHPKLPAIKWARYQHTHPSDDDLRTWFHGHDDAGIGIVCGRISRLIVLDFDDASVASEFRRLYPDLTDTFTVRSGTRGLPHFYYRLPEGKLITTSAYSGADLRGEGAYVVAPPTYVNGMEWQVENDVPIHAVSEFELRRMIRFLAGLKVAETQPISGVSNDVLTAQASEFRHLQSDIDLVMYYRQHINLGRNQALFKAAVMARDADIPETTCCFILASVHAREPGAVHEDYQSRYGEGIRTISSAYKRPMRQSSRTSQIGLGNAAREWLLGHELTGLARVLDGLYVIGMQPNDCFTELQVCQKLAPLRIGRRSIMAALKASIGDRSVFESPLYPPESANAANRSDDLNNSCEMSRGAMRVKSLKRGRPAKMYRLPSPNEIAVMIGIKTTPSDIVAVLDFASPRTYRLALHKQLLERRPGHYTRTWLGARLGVSRWTTRRYEKAASLYVKPVFDTQVLSWSNAAKLPLTLADASYGTFLEASDGSRYPALRGVAFKLLKQGHELLLKHQRPNYYAATPLGVGIPTPQLQSASMTTSTVEQSSRYRGVQPNISSVGIPTASTHARSQQSQDVSQPPSVGIPTPPQPDPIFWLCPDCLDFHVMVDRPDACTRCGPNAHWEVVPHAIWHDAQALKYWWQKRYRDHKQLKLDQSQTLFAPKTQTLPAESNALAEQVHAEIPGISFANARKVVLEFGRYLIEKALRVIRERKGLRSPAGFLIAFLRSEQRLLSDNTKVGGKSKRKAKNESTIEWMRQLAKSQYLSFISNADEILSLGLSNEPSPA